MYFNLPCERFGKLVGILCCLGILHFYSTEVKAEPRDLLVLTVGFTFEDDPFQRQALEVFATGLFQAKVAKLELVPAQGPGNSNQILLDAVRNGKTDLALVPFDVLARENASFGIFTTPFLFENFPHLSAVQRGTLGQTLLQDLRQNGVRGVSWWAGEFVSIAGERPALDPRDLKGRRIAYQPMSIDGLKKVTAVPELSKAVGAMAVPRLPASFEATVSLEAVDLVEATPRQLQRTNEAPRFITLTNHLNAGYAVVANPSIWDKLSTKSRAALVNAFNRAYDIATEGLQRQEESLFQRAPSNAAVMALTSTDRAQWREQTGLLDREGKIGLLIEQARDYPVTRLVSTPAPDARISWNAWIEDGQGKDTAMFIVGRVSRINLDLGRLPYHNILTASPDARIRSALSGGNPVNLLVQPILLGSQLEAAPGQTLKAKLMTVSLKNVATLATDQQKRKDYWDGKLSTRQLATTLGLGEIAQWSIKANQQGCANIAFAVWDEAGVEPLDHIVVSFPVQSVTGKKVACYGKADSRAMAAGLETMLWSPRIGQTAADASLHVFEYSDSEETKSVAVLVHARRLATARNNSAATDPGVYSWVLNSTLSEYASTKPHLPKLVEEAHQRLNTNKPFPYEDVASDLAAVLFSGRRERDIDQAKIAKEAFKDIVVHGNPARVLMRLVNKSGGSMYLPLGLLAAGSSKPFVAKRFSVIQSLAGAVSPPATCIRSWHIARSQTLKDAVGDSLDLLKSAPNVLPPQMELMTTHKAVAQYLASQPTGTDGEGFIILAHHEAGILRFSPEDHSPPWIRSDYINRHFPPGSLGVLAACSTTGSGQQTSAIVDRLTSQGISSIVLSPFPVDLRYGVRLALAFEHQVLHEVKKPTGATAAVLFERSAAEVTASLPAVGGLHDMALEFQLVGDPDIMVCAEQGG